MPALREHHAPGALHEPQLDELSALPGQTARGPGLTQEADVRGREGADLMVAEAS